MIVGLGNPGKRYERTPHNAGFHVIDILAQRLDCRLRRSLRHKARIGSTAYSGTPLKLVKPMSYMNLSGAPVAGIARKSGVEPTDIIAVFDDANLEQGRIRIRAHGSDGGHKGVRSMIEHLGSDRFVRVRMGVGSNPDGTSMVQHVLRRFTREDWESMMAMAEKSADAVLCVLDEGIDEAMNRFNARNTENKEEASKTGG